MSTTFSNRSPKSVAWLFVLFLSAFANDNQSPKTLSPARLAAEGDAALQNRDYDKAVKYYSSLIEVEPTKHVNWHKRAMAHLAKNNYHKAISDWTKAVELDESFIHGYYYRGKAQQRIGECGKARSDYSKVYGLDASHEDVDTLIHEAETCVTNYEKALHYLHKKECTLAQPLMEELLTIAPYDTKLNFGMIECHLHNKDYQSVLRYTSNILRIEPQNLETLLVRGRAYYALGEYEMAIKHFKSGLKSDPDHKILKAEFKKVKKLVGLMSDGDGQMEKHSYAEAIDSYEQALSVDENHDIIRPRLYEKLCEASVRNRKATKEQRLKFCGDSLKHNPDKADAFYWRGQAHEMNGDLEQAERDYQEAVNRDRNNREFMNKLHHIQTEQKKAKRKNYYKILGITEHASERDIKKAFRKCGLEHHPDKVKDLPEEQQKEHEIIFKDCVEAQEILTNAELRQKYDRGEDVLEQMQGGNRGPPQGFPFSFFTQGFTQGQKTYTFRFG